MLAMACREGGGGGERGLETRVIHLQFYTVPPRDEVRKQPGSRRSIAKGRRTYPRSAWASLSSVPAAVSTTVIRSGWQKPQREKA